MAISTQRKVTIDEDIDRKNPLDPVASDRPDIHVDQTSYPPSSGSVVGYFIAALVLFVGLFLALYYGTRPDTTAPINLNNTTESAPTPPAAQAPPAAPTQPALPDTTNQQPEESGSGNSNTTGQ